MSDIKELADELGVDLSKNDNEVPEDKIEVITAEQYENSEKLIQECKEIYKKGRENDLVWRWEIGQKVDAAYADENKFQKGTLKRLSDELDISVSDLSRFKKFYLSFNKEMLIERASVGYTWSHFKLINDLPDGSIKERMINLMQEEDEAPKTKDLQETISNEKNQQLDRADADAQSSASTSDGEKSSSSSKSAVKPINSALIAIEKLSDYLGDIALQEESGIDFDTDAKQEKYDEAMDELNTRLKEIEKIRIALFEKS